MTLYKNKYRVESARLRNWDYSASGSYFVTICTHKHECFLGKIVNGNMILSETGKIVLQKWNKSFKIRRELHCDCFVIMPNHIHTVVMIDNIHHVETHGRASLQQPNQTSGVALRRPKSVSSFMAGFKSSATKQINECRHTPARPVWQSRFYDHIVRDEKELHRIHRYILNNPAQWRDDKFYSGENP